jgi:hypothetical protein
MAKYFKPAFSIIGNQILPTHSAASTSPQNMGIIISYPVTIVFMKEIPPETGKETAALIRPVKDLHDPLNYYL